MAFVLPQAQNVRHGMTPVDLNRLRNPLMKKTLLYFFALAALSATLSAQDAPAGCTDSMLQGTYAGQLSGTAPAVTIAAGGSALPGTLQNFVGMVIGVFDGKGTFTQVDFLKGTLSGFSPARPGKGVYKINADCTGTITVVLPVAPFEIVTQIILIDGGKRIIGIVSTPANNMTTLSSERVR
jgi:hypothetical protein